MLLRCRSVSADLRLLFWLSVLLIQIVVGDWMRQIAHSLRWNTTRARAGASGRLSLLLFIREQPWTLMLYALCLLAGDTTFGRTGK